MSIIRSAISYVAAAFKKEEEHRQHTSDARGVYFTLQRKASQLALEGKNLSDSDATKLLAAAEQIGLSAAQIAADRQLLDGHLPDQAVADQVPKLEQDLEEKKEQRRKIASSMPSSIVAFSREREAGRQKKIAAHQAVKAKLEAAIAAGADPDTIAKLQADADRARAARLAHDEETPRLKKQRQQDLNAELEASRVAVQSALHALNAAKRKAAEVEARELKHWELFGRPTPEVQRATKERERRRRHIAWGTLPPADAAAMPYQVLRLEALLNPMCFHGETAKLEFVQMPGQSDDDFACRKSIVSDHVRRDAGPQATRPVYLVSRTGKRVQADPSAKDMMIFIEDLEQQPRDPSRCVAIRWAGQSERELQSFVQRWQAAWQKELERRGRRDRERRHADRPFGALVG